MIKLENLVDVAQTGRVNFKLNHAVDFTMTGTEAKLKRRCVERLRGEQI
jgi:hypothetical protein